MINGQYEDRVHFNSDPYFNKVAMDYYSADLSQNGEWQVMDESLHDARYGDGRISGGAITNVINFWKGSKPRKHLFRSHGSDNNN